MPSEPEGNEVFFFFKAMDTLGGCLMVDQALKFKHTHRWAHAHTHTHTPLKQEVEIF